MIRIPYLHTKYLPEGKILVGPKAGKKRYYLDSLYNSLVELKPKICLEIGTHYGGSSAVFQEYFNEFMQDGRLITCDIRSYTDLSNLPNVTPVIVHPHADNMSSHHIVNQESLLPVPESPIDNIRLVLTALCGSLPKNGKVFDFAFIDGDHQVISATKDIAIAEYMLKPGCPFLLDDVDEEYHELSKYYHETMKSSDRWDIYDFEDWLVTTGTALLYPKPREVK